MALTPQENAQRQLEKATKTVEKARVAYEKSARNRDAAHSTYLGLAEKHEKAETELDAALKVADYAAANPFLEEGE